MRKTTVVVDVIFSPSRPITNWLNDFTGTVTVPNILPTTQ